MPGAAQPPGPARAGQRILMHTRAFGLGFRVVFDLKAVDPQGRWLEVDVFLPLGIVNHERITLDPVEGGTLVRFN